MVFLGILKGCCVVFVNLIPAEVVWEEGASVEELPGL